MTTTYNVHYGLTAWQATHAYSVLGARISNAGNAYQVITTGTSAGSGGPTTTAADITDGTVHWKWLSAIDFTSWQDYSDARPNPRLDDHVVQTWNNGIIQCAANTQLLYMSDNGTGSFTTTFKPAPGEGWRDNATTLMFDATKGVTIQLPTGSDTAIGYVWIEAPGVIFDGIQWKDPRETGTSTPLTILGANPIVKNCIFDVHGRSGGKNVELVGTNPLVVNNLFIDRHSTAPQNLLGVATGVSNIVFCWFVATVAAGVGQAIFVDDTVDPGRHIRNCGIFGWSGAEPIWAGASNIITADHCITDSANLGDITVDGGNNLVSKSLTNQVVNTTTDFRIKTGADAVAAGVVSAFATTDIFNHTRGTPPSIGPSELASTAMSATATEAASATATTAVSSIVFAGTGTGAATAVDTLTATVISAVALDSEAASAADAAKFIGPQAVAAVEAAHAADTQDAMVTQVVILGPPVFFGLITAQQLLALGGNGLPTTDPGVPGQIWNNNGEGAVS